MIYGHVVYRITIIGYGNHLTTPIKLKRPETARILSKFFSMASSPKLSLAELKNKFSEVIKNKIKILH